MIKYKEDRIVLKLQTASRNLYLLGSHNMVRTNLPILHNIITKSDNTKNVSTILHIACHSRRQKTKVKYPLSSISFSPYHCTSAQFVHSPTVALQVSYSIIPPAIKVISNAWSTKKVRINFTVIIHRTTPNLEMTYFIPTPNTSDIPNTHHFD